MALCQLLRWVLQKPKEAFLWWTVRWQRRETFSQCEQQRTWWLSIYLDCHWHDGIQHHQWRHGCEIIEMLMMPERKTRQSKNQAKIKKQYGIIYNVLFVIQLCNRAGRVGHDHWYWLPCPIHTFRCGFLYDSVCVFVGSVLFITYLFKYVRFCLVLDIFSLIWLIVDFSFFRCWCSVVSSTFRCSNG